MLTKLVDSVKMTYTDIDRHILLINHKCVYLYQYKSEWLYCRNNA